MKLKHFTVKNKNMHNFFFLHALALAYMCFEYDWPICDCVGIGLGHRSFPTGYYSFILEKACCSCKSFIGTAWSHQ